MRHSMFISVPFEKKMGLLPIGRMATIARSKFFISSGLLKKA